MGHQLLREAAPLRRRMHHEPMHRSSRFARCRPIHALPERVVRGVQCHAACRKTDFVIPRAPDLQRPRRDVPGEAGGVRINLVPLLDAVGAQGIAKSRMVVLTALLRLRQVCCDLRLLKLENVNPANASGKLELFGELLEEVIDGGHRVLVFSQFVGMLTLLKERLAEEGIEYCYLDGSTTDRAKVVEKFQSTTTIPVFLISLKAGGVGLNLTGADTVVHFDPWWNPAVEDQATDRAHRIGQTKVVTSYKLITRDTVEEKILTLQNRKREIIQATIGGEEEFAASLSWDEIQELLA